MAETKKKSLSITEKRSPGQNHIRAALGAMPYGAGVPAYDALSRYEEEQRWEPGPMPDDWNIKVADVLRGVAANIEKDVVKRNEERRELEELRRDVAGLRRLLGIGRS